MLARTVRVFPRRPVNKWLCPIVDRLLKNRYTINISYFLYELHGMAIIPRLTPHPKIILA